MKLFKRGKIWWGRWSIQGRRFQVTSGTDDEKVAREILAKKYADAFRYDRLGEKPRATWEQAVERYLHDRESRRAFDRIKMMVDFWSEQFQQRRLKYLDELTPDVISAIRDAFYNQPKSRGTGPRSPGDVNRKIRALRAVINAAYREYGMFTDGAVAPRYRGLSGEVERIRFITPEEFERLAKALPKNISDAARFAVNTGLRRSNVMYLLWTQVDMADRSVTIDGMYMKNGELLRLPLNNAAYQVLASRYHRREISNHVFANDKGVCPSRVAVATWQRALDQAGIKDFRWHDLRHTWASWLRQRGVPLEVIQELGGWKNYAMVQRYAHQSVEHLRNAAAALDDMPATNLLQSTTSRPMLRAVK